MRTSSHASPPLMPSLSPEHSSTQTTSQANSKQSQLQCRPLSTVHKEQWVQKIVCKKQKSTGNVGFFASKLHPFLHGKKALAGFSARLCFFSLCRPFSLAAETASTSNKLGPCGCCWLWRAQLTLERNGTRFVCARASLISRIGIQWRNHNRFGIYSQQKNKLLETDASFFHLETKNLIFVESLLIETIFLLNFYLISIELEFELVICAKFILKFDGKWIRV